MLKIKKKKEKSLRTSGNSTDTRKKFNKTEYATWLASH